MAQTGRFITEKQRSLPVRGDYDVIVAGGGIGGVSAAVAAARNRAKVCLLEKEYALGGLATLGNVIIYLPLCDGRGTKVMGGIAEELLWLSIPDVRSKDSKRGISPVPKCWIEESDTESRSKERFQAEFNPDTFMLELEELVLQEGIDILYDTRCCAVIKDGDFVDALIVENKEGRCAFNCRVVIDATGDADICLMAGEDLVSLDSNVTAAWYYYQKGNEIHLKMFSRKWDPDCGKIEGQGPFYSGHRAGDVTEQVISARAEIKRQLLEMRGKNPDLDIYPFKLPVFPNLRMTRRLKGEIEIEESDDHRFFPDTIGMTGDWRRRGPVFSIPFRSLKGVKTSNLLTVGRCISAGNTLWDVTRVIPTCAVTGQAAGTAAAMASKESRGDLAGVKIEELQQQLISEKVIIDSNIARP